MDSNNSTVIEAGDKIFTEGQAPDSGRLRESAGSARTLTGGADRRLITVFLLAAVAAAAVVSGRLISYGLGIAGEIDLYPRYSGIGAAGGIKECFFAAVKAGTPTLLTIPALLFLSPSPMFMPAAAAVTAIRALAVGFLIPAFGSTSDFFAHIICFAASSLAIILFAASFRRGKQRYGRSGVPMGAGTYLLAVASGIPSMLICAGACSLSEFALALLI